MQPRAAEPFEDKSQYNTFSGFAVERRLRGAALFGGVMTMVSLAKKTTVCLALVLACGLVTPSYAVSAKSLEKQAKKVEAALAKFPRGAFLHFHFRDGSEGAGKLGNLSENSFSFTNTESNAEETHQYSDVTKIDKGKEYIGKDSASHHHHLGPF
jgi:hypothetical protein